MRKNTIKAFTLTEMLIVIVIIGILIAALLPRMQAAQGRARDVSRKTALSQVQSAIVVWQGDNGKWPGGTGAQDGTGLMAIDEELKNAGITSVPQDPLGSTSFSGLNDREYKNAQYAYMVTTRNGTPNGGFILMAKTEVAGGSNWVMCSGNSVLTGGHIGSGTDITSIHPCETLTRSESGSECRSNTGACVYNDDSQLRYIVMY